MKLPQKDQAPYEHMMPCTMVGNKLDAALQFYKNKEAKCSLLSEGERISIPFSLQEIEAVSTALEVYKNILFEVHRDTIESNFAKIERKERENI